MWWMLIAKAIATHMKAMGQMVEGESAENQGFYNYLVANNNAQQLDWAANQSIDEGKLQEERHRKDVTNLMGAQRVAYAKSGVSGEGTPDDVETGDMIDAEMDNLLIKYNSESKAIALRNAAAMERNRGENEKRLGQYKRDQAEWQAAGTIIGGAGDFAGMGGGGGGGGGG